MNNGSNIFFDQLERILTFWERPLVRNQLLAILITLIIVIVVERILTTRINRSRRQQLEAVEDDTRPLNVRILSFAQRLMLPIIGLLAFTLIATLFSGRQQLNGLIKDVVSLFWQILYFRIAIAVGYELFDGPRWRRIHYRILAPLFWIFIIGEALSDIVNWRQLADYVLGGAADNPLTLGTLVIAVAALYFWSDSVVQFQDVAHSAIVNNTNARPGSVEAGLTLIRYVLLLAGVYLFLLGIGLDSTTIAAITGGLSVGIGFGLQSVIANFVSGIILLFEGSIRPGDRISVGGATVMVDKMGIRATRVRNDDNIEIIVPNQDLFGSQVTTVTGTDTTMRVHIPAGASYNDDPDKVIAVLEEVAQGYPNRLPDKDVAVVLTNFGDSAIDYDIRIWIDRMEVGPGAVRVQINRLIQKAFEEHGIEMPFPQRDVNFNWDGYTPTAVAPIDGQQVVVEDSADQS